MGCHKIDGEKCKKVIESLLDKGEFAEAETNGCCGYKHHTDGCTLKGVFDKDSPICQECYEDAMAAMSDDMKDCERLY